MSGETYLTIVGNLVRPFELRFTPSGAAVANGTVAVTPRTFDKQTNDWKDGTTAFWDVSVWREQAESVAESFPEKGVRVIVYGRIKTEEWEDKNGGGKRSKQTIEAEDIGPSLRYATAKVTRTQKGGGQGGSQGGGFGGHAGGPPAGPPAGGGFGGQGGGRPPQGQQGRNGPPAYGNQSDPWQGQQGGGQYDWGSGQEEEPPF